MSTDGVVERLSWNAEGLICAVAVEHHTSEVLMLAWMNADALRRTLSTRRATYFSRSRGELWTKGETSGNTQHVREIRHDCDADTLLLRVEQSGPACHTGTRSCFDSAERVLLPDE